MCAFSESSHNLPPARLLTPALPPLPSPSFLDAFMFKGRDVQSLSCQPASTTCCPSHGAGEESSEAQPHFKALPISPSPALQPRAHPRDPNSRNKYSVLNVFPQLAANPTNHRLTCTRGWEPPAGSGSLARSPPPRRHRRARPRTHRGLWGKPHQNQTPVNFGRALWRTTVSCQPSLKVK